MIRADRTAACLGRAAFVAMLAAGIVSCEDNTAPGRTTIPTFVYVADTAGYPSLIRFRNDSAVVLTVGSKNTEPKSAAGRLVFTSERDGLPQVYISDLDVTTPHRVLATLSFDRTPALSQVGYDTSVALATGSADFTPEDAPAWSPTGGKIVFTSVASGTSQIY